MSLPYFPEAIELFPDLFTAIVEEPITPATPGRVRFQASYWFAEVYTANSEVVKPGTIVQVVGRRGITLLVLPLADKVRLPERTEPTRPQSHSGQSGWFRWFSSIFA